MFGLIVAAILGLGAAATVAVTNRTARPGRTDRQRRERRRAATTRRKKREAKRDAPPEPDEAPAEPDAEGRQPPPKPPKPPKRAKTKEAPPKKSAPATKKDAAKIATHKVKLEPTPDVAPKVAAASLYKFAQQKIRDEEFAALGTKGHPSKKVEGYQRAMRNLKTDGQYGSKTRARGTELLGKPFPIRRKAAPPVPEPEPEVESPPAEPEARLPPPEPPPEPKPVVFDEPEPEPEPEGRTQPEAAHDMLRYVQAIGKKGRARALGYGGRPNARIEADQADMGEIKADGIYGDKTRDRGRELIDKHFPAR